MARNWIVLLLVNAVLSVSISTLVPAQPARSDRLEYEYSGQHPLAPDCPYDVYCYRVLVPFALEQLPFDSESRWRTYAWTTKALAGFVTALATAQVSPMWQAPILVSLIVQSSFGFALTAYDPYTADPLVFLVASLMALFWIRRWPWLALVVTVIGVFGKETVAVIAVCTAIAAFLHRRNEPQWRLWVLVGVAACALVLGFHWYMDTYRGWGIGRNVASKFSEGGWIAVWLANMDSLRRIVFLLFIPFALVWLYGPAGYRNANRRLQMLALGSLLPLLALNYVQNPERALGNGFFFMAPLAALFLSRVPVPLGFAAVVTNALVTVKAGTTTELLPSTSVLVIPAAMIAVWAFWLDWRARKSERA